MLPSKDSVLAFYNKAASRVKQYALNLTPLELKVDEATNNEPWGPHGTAMAEISRAAYDYEGYREIMGVIARRLQSEGENWRHVYKSLLLLEYMAKHGPQKVVDELSSNLGVVERLQRFEHTDKNGRDWGLNVRQRAKELAALVGDPDRIRRERAKAKQNESKYTGVSADESRSGFGYGGGGGTSYSSGGGARGGGGLGGSIASQGFGSNSGRFGASYSGGGGGGGSYSSGGGARRYDDDFDEPKGFGRPEEQDELDAREATRRRIESLKQAAPGELAGSRASPPPRGGVEAEARQPKRLSQVKVDPSIAKSLGVPAPAPRPAAAAAAAPAAASAAPGGDILDLFDAPAAAPAAAQPAAAAEDAAWDAFAGATAAAPAAPQAAQQDDWASLLDGSSAPAAAAAPAAPAPTADPFAQLSAGGSSAAADPFASFGEAPLQKKASGPLPLAPAPPLQSADPFAALAGPAAKPASPLKAAAGASPTARGGGFGQDPFAAAGAAKAGAPKLGGALPEDMFSAPAAPQAFAGTQVRVGAGGTGGGAFGGSSPAPSGGSPAWAQQQQQQGGGGGGGGGFGAFSAAPASGSTEDLFGSMSLSGPSGDASGQPAVALGGGQKMAPNLPQPKLPPPVVKSDPFAGLAGF